MKYLHLPAIVAAWDYLAPFNSSSARLYRGEKFEDVFGDHYDAVDKIFTKIEPIAGSLAKSQKINTIAEAPVVKMKKGKGKSKVTVRTKKKK